MLEKIKNFNLPEIEEKVLGFWRKNKIFEKSVALRQAQGKKSFRFFEGPPTANGRPGTHHVLSRAFKDIILRYKTMRGYYVSRRAGWDTHGLPVEIEVEKELGIKQKSEIEKFGIAEFNSRAKLSTWKYKAEWEKLTERIGFWLDFKNPYITYHNSYIETLWWILKQVGERGLLKKLYKVVAWCPRCQTPLSNHELGQPDVYRKTKDPSVYVKFKVSAKGGSASGGKSQKSKVKGSEYFLVWTTTPWTLPANVAVAVDPKLTYTKYQVGEDFFWSYNPPPKVSGPEISVVEKIAGSKLVGRRYEPLYKITRNQEPGTRYQIVAADFITTLEGTGLVHIAPAFGEDDLKLWQSADPPAGRAGRATLGDIPVTIDDRGTVLKGFPGAGKFIKEADKDIAVDLKGRNLLYYETVVEHEYPFCWRCSTPLIYFARLTWFIEMSKLRPELLAANEKINWIPAHIKEGRFGEWLKETKDWAISRERYWGTPLPIWECGSCSAGLVLGSFEELNSHAYYKNKFFLVRHPEADHNLSWKLAGGREVKGMASRLTKKGMARARELGEELKRIGVDLIIYSPYTRTKETAKIIAKVTKAKIIPEKRIGEINAGIFNNQKAEKFGNFFSKFEERFTKTPPGGENLMDVRRRMTAALKDANNRYQDKNIVIVSHGDPLWVLEAAVKNIVNEKFGSVAYPETGSLRELIVPNWPYNTDGELDWHRPFIDEIVLACPKCAKKMTRVREVADVWFDSGAMPFAQWHYPFENKNLIDKRNQFPADYIAEGVDQTRGWFYTLLAISVLLRRGPSYLNVISTGLVLDKYGQKMSKSKGNTVDPWAMIQKYGADVLRWYFYTINDPGDPKKFDENDLLKVFRKFHLLFYNSFVFLKTYEDTKTRRVTPLKPRMLWNILDRWIVSRWQETLAQTTRKLDQYEIGQAARIIETFVQDLSHWYIRRSRKRFSQPVSKQDFNSAAETLTYVIRELSKIVAPFCPYLAEAVYASLIGKDKKLPPSVHLADWPRAEKKLVDKKLMDLVSAARDLASKALALRAELGIKVRQPLAELKIKDPRLLGGQERSKIKANKELINILKDEINVHAIVFDKSIKNEIEFETTITPELYEEGVLRELVRTVQKLRQDAGYHYDENIYLSLSVPKELGVIVERRQKLFKQAVKASRLEILASQGARALKVDAELETKLDNFQIWIGVRKTF